MTIKGLVLAAGRGSRMGRTTQHQPKCLVEVNGRSLLSYQIDALKKGGCETVGVVSGYCREQINDFFDFEFHNIAWSTTNMVKSLLCADNVLKHSTCIVSYSDLFYFEDAISALVKSESDICVLYDENWYDLWSARFENPLDDAESFIIDSNQILQDIGQKTTNLSEVQGQYMGIFKLTTRGWNLFVKHAEMLFERDGVNIYITDVLQSIAKSGDCDINAVPFSGKWGEIDSESDLEYYNGEAC